MSDVRSWILKIEQLQELEEKYPILFSNKCKKLEEIVTFLGKYELEITMKERKEHLH